ncbi:MAG TPA: hypothetical protein VFC72_03845 [Corynebacterium sp.]|nr:hypothetical protein [Corynebacterium sp.]
MTYTLISDSPLKHTYPYGRYDVEVPLGTVAEITASLAEVFRDLPACRRVLIAIEQDDGAAARVCEEAGFHYVLDVQTRDGRELSLMSYEPAWVTEQSTDITDLELT